MKKIRKFMICLSTIVMMLILSQDVIAANDNVELKELEYTDEYQNWLNLSEEEKSKSLQPKKYSIETNNEDYLGAMNNPFKLNYLLSKSNDTRYSLQDVIGDNTKIRNQGSTELCWDFASLGVVETNLALQDYKNSNALRIYDFSEAHMAYATVRNAFFNNQVNEKGMNRRVGASGNFYIAQNYLTNGSGAVDEHELAFENIGDNIDIAKIQNNNVITTLYDTVEFSYRSENEKPQLIQNMKSHITEYGGLYAGVYGANVFDSNYYNNITGALYVDNSAVKMDHAVVIIGWDDEYSNENFNENHRPQNNGAWIAKNSWGEQLIQTLEDAKKANFEYNKEQYAQMGIYDYQTLPNDPFIQEFINSGYTPNEDNTVFTYPVGQNGYIYISYEDANVYQSLWGVKKVVAEKDYENIFQNDLLGFSQAVQLQSEVQKIYIANVFKRTENKIEALDRVSFYTMQNWKNCKVYVNPNGESKAVENLQEVKIKDGNIAKNSIDIDVGYHTIELAESIQLTSDNFAVVLEFETEERAIIPIEAQTNNGWENAIVNSGESFFAIDSDFEENRWQDFALLENESIRGNVVLKAFTTKETTINASLTNIAITKQPNKTEYKQGEDFEATGMEVTATYANGEKRIVTNYTIEDGIQLAAGKTSVIVSYTEGNVTQRARQPITVLTKDIPKNKSPKASDFGTANAFITDMNINAENNVGNITVKVSNIKIGDEDDKYTYYYCILGTSDSTEVKDSYWIEVASDKVYRQADGTCNLILDINLKEQVNLNAFSNSNKIYLHLKEKAEINNQSIESIHALDIHSNVDTGNIKEVSKSQNADSTDQTVANTILPKAGKWNILIGMIVILGMGTFCYVRYKNIDK